MNYQILSSFSKSELAFLVSQYQELGWKLGGTIYRYNLT